MIGRSLPRKEDRPLLTGAARFVDDLHRPGMLHATILRSPHGHARVLTVDAGQARRHPGVAAVITADELGEGGPPIPMRMFAEAGMEQYLQRPLASSCVRYSGEPVAVVVATSRYVAEDAAELVSVEYEPLEPVVDAERALEAGAARVHDSTAGNLVRSFRIESGDVDAAFAAADVVVQARIVCHRHGAVPMETRGLVAEFDPATGELTVWGAAKIPHVNRRILARMLGLPEERVRLVELAVGGGFGARGEFYPEDYLIPWCARHLGRAVRWIEDREEHLRATNHSRQQVHEIALALDADGHFTALRDAFINDTGAYVRTHGSVVPGMTAGLLPGPYRWQAFRCEVRQVVTNKTPAGTYRAPGRYEANLARERIIDLAARRLQLDPVDVRRRNLIAPEAMPYVNGSHTDGHPVVYDCGDYPRLLDKGLARFDLPAMRRWRDADPGPGRKRGIGTAMFIEKSGIGGWEYARVSLSAEGRPQVHCGSASLGQGVDTVLAQICAEHLGVSYDAVSVHHGDTSSVPDGMGSFGSRATMLAGGAVRDAAIGLRRRLLELAADELEASADDLELVDDRVRVRGEPSSRFSLAALAELARPAASLPRGRTPYLSDEAYFAAEQMSFPYGLHCASVEVDLETGGVAIHRYTIAYDVGRAVNPQLVEGQIVGGAAQGMGGALLEELVYEPSGQLVSGSFMDYLLPTAAEVPRVDVLVTEDAPTPLNPLGVKGAGEGGTAAAGAVIANAVSDALGVEVLRLPLSPQHVLELAGQGSGS
ncbi:MAG TPA: xanthine dehydrogenase family protein molybdopterin-binding subunit [Solirubrobacteraceae bacterium]|nr:xanthine dehydrogenase family protein molybdopterin-binding subunit [Solirubrobacteraceae bacterium]